MKRILGALALGVALSLSIAATPAETGNTARDSECMTTTELSLGKEMQGTSQEMNTVGSGASNISNELRGTLTNNSLNQGYEDVEIRVDYLNNEGTPVGSETVTVHKDIDPGSTESFTESLNPVAGATNASYSIVCAEEDRGWIEKLQFWR